MRCLRASLRSTQFKELIFICYILQIAENGVEAEIQWRTNTYYMRARVNFK